MGVIDRRLNYGRAVIEGFAQKIAPFGSIMDLGAGSGDDLELARQASPGTICYAVESYPPNVEMLRQRNVEVASLNLERDRLPFEKEFFDVVMANQVFEHLKEIFWVLHEVSRTLKVGGHFILGVPNLASLHNRMLLLAGMQPTCIQNHSAHVRGYTRHDLLKMLRMIYPCGYALKQFSGSNFYPLPGFLARPSAWLLPNAAASIFLLLKKNREYAGEFLAHPLEARLETNFFLGERGQEFGHQL